MVELTQKERRNIILTVADEVSFPLVEQIANVLSDNADFSFTSDKSIRTVAAQDRQVIVVDTAQQVNVDQLLVELLSSIPPRSLLLLISRDSFDSRWLENDHIIVTPRISSEETSVISQISALFLLNWLKRISTENQPIKMKASELSEVRRKLSKTLLPLFNLVYEDYEKRDTGMFHISILERHLNDDNSSDPATHARVAINRINKKLSNFGYELIGISTVNKSKLPSSMYKEFLKQGEPPGFYTLIEIPR